MENKNAQLIRKYMNLMESIETKIIVEEKSTDINEDLLASAAREGKLIASELEGFLKMMKQDSKISAELVKSGIRDAEELLLALKGNRLSASLKGSLELNILKSQTTNAKLIDLASENLSRNQKFLQKYSNEIKQGQPQFEAALKKSGYSNRAITKIVEKAYLKKSSGLKTVSAKNKELANKQLVGKNRLMNKLSKKPTDPSFTSKIKNWTKTKGEELKNLLKSGKNWKKILAWGLGLGIPLTVLYWMVKDSGETVPQDLPTTPPIDSEWAPCIQNLINNKSGVVSVSPSGEVSVLVTKTGNEEWDKMGGLKFYSNGRVWSVDNVKKGSWTCKDGEVQTNEMYLNEQSSSLTGDVEKMVDLLDFPVSGSDLTNAKNLLQKYTTNGQGKEFLNLYQKTGLGKGSLKKSLDYIPTFNASSVQLKDSLYSLINKINSGTSSPSTGSVSSPSTGGGIGDINITWDGEKTSSPTTTEPVTPVVKSSGGTKKSKYTDRNKFPYSLGHRSSIIKEVQVCFGFPKKYQTGNFGPITLKKLQDLYGVSEINESTYKLIKEKCKSKPTTGTTTNTSTTTTNTVTPTSTVTPTNTGTTTTTTQPIKTPLTRENCEKLFKEILKRDDKDGGRTATDDEIVKCQKCLQQYNFGIGQGAAKIKRAYALTSSGGNKGIRK
jgi:hypothetical protein